VLAQVSADVLKPDLAFLVVVYLGLHHAELEGTLAVLAIGYLADLFSVQPDGAFLLVYFASFYLAAGASKVFYFRGTSFPAVMVFSLSLIYATALAWMTRSAAPDPSSASVFSWGFLFAFSTANVLFSLPLFRVCRMVDSDGNLGTGRRATLS
jgi:rod shape-determining protein MreD